MNYYLGLDLGGTSIKSGLVDDHGRLLAKVTAPTQPDRGVPAIIAALVESATAVASRAGVDLANVTGIGIGSPGPVDIKNGIVEAAPNLPQLKGVPLRDRIAQATDRPVTIENDANAAALAEFWFGVASDPSIRYLVMLTLGTGIGSGVIVDGILLHGAHQLGGECGHMIVEPNGRRCSCGQHGCLEAYSSAAHTARRAVEAIESGHRSTLLSDILESREEPITSADVFRAATGGDSLCRQIVDETAAYLAIACVSLCRLFDPQMIILGGGMAQAGAYLIDRVQAAFDQHDWRMSKRRVQIVSARFKNDAGVLGAAAVARNAHAIDPSG